MKDRVIFQTLVRNDLGASCPRCGQAFEVGDFIAKLGDRSFVHNKCVNR